MRFELQAAPRGPVMEATLASQWLGLEAQAPPTIFASWAWVGGWWRPLPPEQEVWLLRGWQGATLCALGLFTLGRERRTWGWPRRVARLHSCGDARWDDITIEHTRLLTHPTWTAEVEARFFAQPFAPFEAAGLEVDELQIRAASAVPAAWLASRAGQQTEPVVRAEAEAEAEPATRSGQATWREEAAWRVRLGGLRASGRPYIESLGAATRATVRKSLRRYAGLGALRLTRAQSLDQAHAFLQRLVHFHQQRWQSLGQPGAFHREGFTRFHRELVDQAWPDGRVALLRLSAGEHEVGYLYNFLEGDAVRAYQSGLNYGLLPGNHHPGLALHTLAVDQSLCEGRSCYDFMAGPSRYKEQLCNEVYALSDLRLRRLAWSPSSAWQRVRQGAAELAGLGALKPVDLERGS